jgi:hypothetical protein
MEVVGVDSFSLKSIYAPTSRVFIYELSALMNFTRFATDLQKCATALDEEMVT